MTVGTKNRREAVEGTLGQEPQPGFCSLLSLPSLEHRYLPVISWAPLFHEDFGYSLTKFSEESWICYESIPKKTDKG